MPRRVDKGNQEPALILMAEPFDESSAHEEHSGSGSTWGGTDHQHGSPDSGPDPEGQDQWWSEEYNPLPPPAQAWRSKGAPSFDHLGPHCLETLAIEAQKQRPGGRGEEQWANYFPPRGGGGGGGGKGAGRGYKRGAGRATKNAY